MPSGYSLSSFCRYTTFGSVAKGRSFSSTAYRYGFNGKEKEDEISGNGNEYDFGSRTYDPRLGRWWSIDPFVSKYPNVTPYSFGLNNPISLKDEGGKWITDVNGKPIYTSEGQTHELAPDGKSYLVAEVRTYYTNDGQAVYAKKYTGMIKVENCKTVESKISYSTKDLEKVPEDLAYDCHGNSCFPGENIYIPGNDPEGNNNAEKIFKNKSEYTHVGASEAKEGDIKLYGANGALNHSATRDAKGTYTSKDDRSPIRHGVAAQDMAGAVDPKKGTWGVALIGNYRHLENKNGGVESNNGEVSKEVAAKAIENAKSK